MTFRLALKNIVYRPFRAVATALAIAVAVAMIFCMLSMKGAIYDYIFSSETAISGESDILVGVNSSSDRITSVAEPLYEMDEIERMTASLSLYATYNDEYVRVRGFEKGHIEDLQKLDIVSFREGVSSVGDLREDDVVISTSAAKHFGLKPGDRVELTLGANSAPLIIGGVAKGDGYFLSDAPYLFVGHITDGVARLLSSVGLRDVCNEIYVKLKPGVDKLLALDKISEIYSDMLVRLAGDDGYISNEVDALTAPIVLAGAAVLVLSLAIIFLLFFMSEPEKVALISKLRMIGATKKQLVFIFLTESLLLSTAGALIGLGLAAGAFTLILKVTLSSVVSYKIPLILLFVAALIGLVASVASSLLPIVRALGGSIRSNQLGGEKPSKLSYIACAVMAICDVVLLAVMIFADIPVMAQAILGVAGLAALLVSVGLIASPVMKFFGNVAKRTGKIGVISCASVTRIKRHARSATLLAVGMTVCMLLFMAWSLTTSIFSSYVDDFSNMIFVNNVQASTNVDEFKEFDGVELAAKIVWQQGKLKGDGFDKTVNVLGSKDALELVDFEFVTSKETVYQRISSDEPYVFADMAFSKLYGVKEGDEIELTVQNETKRVKVGGILSHRLFNGQYIVISEVALEKTFGVKPDTVVLSVKGDIDEISNALRSKFASRNFYVIKTLDAYKWEMQSTQSVFDLVGTYAAVVALFILVVTVAATLVGRGTEEKRRNALLNAGMSKNALLKEEIAEHIIVAFAAFSVALIASAPLTYCLIVALRLFGLYFGYMYEIWVTVAVGAVMAALFSIVPLVMRFKRGYSIKKL